MNARKKITSLLGGAATIAAVVGMTAGLTPASAAPSQSPGSNLTIVDQNITGAGYNRVIVQGVYPMQKPDAVGYLNNLTAGCGGMRYIVRGDDGNERHLLDLNYPGVQNDIDGFVRASDRGVEYLQQFVVPASVLDEDKDGTDEVFVRARFVDGDCGSRVQNTNVVKGEFGRLGRARGSEKGCAGTVSGQQHRCNGGAGGAGLVEWRPNHPVRSSIG